MGFLSGSQQLSGNGLAPTPARLECHRTIRKRRHLLTTGRRRIDRATGLGYRALSPKTGGPFPEYGNIQKLGANNVSPSLARQSEPSLNSQALLASNVPSGTNEAASLASLLLDEGSCTDVLHVASVRHH